LKWTMKSRAIWLSIIFLAAVGEVVASDKHGRPPSANLNGISSFAGEKCAFFIIIPVGQQHELNFMLAEGESRFGITLLSVNVAANSVEIDNRGTKQTLHICSTPDVSPTTVRWMTSQPAGHVGGNVNGGEEAGAGNTGSNGRTDGSDDSLNPGGIAGGSHADGASGDNNNTGSGNNVTGGDGADGSTDAAPHQSANLNGSDPATALKDQAGEYWYQTSASIEESRKADAQLILSGEEDPLPLTPLTPAGTPAGLIGSDALFANHLPGFYGH
jgi:hypothetical protein